VDTTDETSLRQAALACEDCVGWLQHCEAECCTLFHFILTPRADIDYGTDVVHIHAFMSPDLARYYELHGAKLEGDFVIVPRAACVVTPDMLTVNLRCTALGDDLLCRLHPDGKPESCTGLTLETAEDEEYDLTPRCLFRHKLAAERER